LLVAALFRPALRRIQTLVDRRFNRARYDAQLTVERFVRHARGAADPVALSSELRSAAAATLQPTRSSVWLSHTHPYAGRHAPAAALNRAATCGSGSLGVTASHSSRRRSLEAKPDFGSRGQGPHQLSIRGRPVRSADGVLKAKWYTV
jgi:hypothetical protein